MNKEQLSDKKKLLLAAAVLILVYSLLVLVTFHEFRKFAASDAEKNLQNFLLSQHAIRSFVQSTQKEELYRLKREKLLYQEYFSPKLLSSTYITRNIKDVQNAERREKGLDEMYFKFASSNPRNSINQADSGELALLQDFNAGSISKYQAVVDTPEGQALYYALPIARNEESCMDCHGDPAAAPRELLDAYGDEAGFYEKVGDIRAFTSVRIPMAGLMKEAHRTALGLSVVSFVLFSGIFWLIYLHFRRSAEQELIAERLRKAEKMESIGLMAGGVAHDLNNILAGIINYPELMLRKLPPESDMRTQLQAVQHSGYRAAAVVSDLLTVARGVATKKDLCDLAQLVRELLKSPEMDRLQVDWSQIKLSVSIGETPLPISCSEIHVSKSVMNLLTNAFEASRIGCYLETGVYCLGVEEAGQYNAIPGDYCFIRVKDSGSGISNDDLQHIFEPFYSTKKMGKSGTGLGLSVVWNTVKDHDGIVIVDSCEDGSTFSLYFPLEHRSVQHPQAGPFDFCPKGRGESVLVVDDEPHLCDIAVSILTDLDYAAVFATSGDAALQYLADYSVDLVLLDMSMEPGISGLETYKRIVELYPEQKAVIVSGFSTSDDVKATLALGAGAFIKKPYSSAELGQVIQTVLSEN